MSKMVEDDERDVLGLDPYDIVEPFELREIIEGLEFLYGERFVDYLPGFLPDDISRMYGFIDEE